MHVAEWLGVRTDTVRDWRSGRMEPRPEVWADLLALLEHRQKWLRGIEQEPREWLARQPSKDSKDEGNFALLPLRPGGQPGAGSSIAPLGRPNMSKRSRARRDE